MAIESRASVYASVPKTQLGSPGKIEGSNSESDGWGFRERVTRMVLFKIYRNSCKKNVLRIIHKSSKEVQIRCIVVKLSQKKRGFLMSKNIYIPAFQIDIEAI